MFGAICSFRLAVAGCLWYSFEKDYLLSGWAHMKALGIPDDVDTTGLSEAELRCLAGEGFAAPCAALAASVFYFNPLAPWWRPL